MKSLLLEHKMKFILYVIACLIPVFFQLMQIGIIALIFETVERQSMVFFKTAILISVGFLIVNAGLYILSRMLRISYMRDVLLSLRLSAFDKILSMSHKQFSKQSRDVYVSHLINDVNTFENSFFLSLINVIFRIGLYISVITILFFLNWVIAGIVLVASVFVLLLSKLYEKKTVHYQKEVSSANERFTLEASNMFNGLEVLKLNNIEDIFLNKGKTHITDLEGKKLKFNLFTALQMYTNVTIGYLLFMGLLIFLMYQTKEGLGLGEMVLTIQLSSSAVFPLVNMTPLINVLKSSKAIYEKITSKETVDETNGRSDHFTYQEGITLKDVQFSYDEAPLLKKTSLTINKGEKYLVRGPSGAGKSTLIKLLSQVIEDYQGDIFIDKKPLNSISGRAYNEKVAYIYQDVFLFEASLKDNVTLFKEASDEAVLKACRAAGMAALIEALPQGIHTPISENGKNLSGGERQRVSIARALFKSAEILFIDEATSALNDALGRQIESTILSLDATVIAISHKTFEGITAQYDWVLELKDGYLTPYEAKDYFEEAIR